MQCAALPSFLRMLAAALAELEQPKDYAGLEAWFDARLADSSPMSLPEKRKLLMSQSRLQHNTWLWRRLQPQAMRDLIKDEPVDGPCTDQMIEHCSGYQLDSLVGVLEPDARERFMRVWFVKRLPQKRQKTFDAINDKLWVQN